MATYDLWLLVLMAPALWWLVAMVRAVVDLRARAVPMTDWERSAEETSPCR
ncbi:MAG: hypothetical protein Q8K72_13305 [Acidimicrobiales bacterium]|nr:hypothetical protein [Acidimicrobiales bacterium]